MTSVIQNAAAGGATRAALMRSRRRPSGPPSGRPTRVIAKETPRRMSKNDTPSGAGEDHQEPQRSAQRSSHPPKVAEVRKRMTTAGPATTTTQYACEAADLVISCSNIMSVRT